MNKQAISNALKALQKTVKKHSPEILTGIGIGTAHDGQQQPQGRGKISSDFSGLFNE